VYGQGGEDVALIQNIWIVSETHLLVPLELGKSRTCIVVTAGLSVIFPSRYSDILDCHNMRAKEQGEIQFRNPIGTDWV